MSIKPFSEVVSEKEEKREVVKPFVDEASGGKELEVLTADNEEIKEQVGMISNSINFLGSLQGLFSVLTLFILVAVGVDAFQTIESLFVSTSIVDGIYLAALLILASTLTLITYKNYKQIKSLKSAQKIQELFAKQKITPDKKIVPATLSLLRSYESRKDDKLQQKVQLLQSRISSSHDYKEIYKDLDEDVINVIDIQVQEKIKTASIQAAISTAISPLALLDSLVIVWRSVLLTKEIANLYGHKPGWLSTVILLKQGAFNVFFAGATELALEYANELAESSLITKISTSAGQGISNGVLLARLGYGVMQACRPLPMRVKRSSFMKGIYNSIKDLVIKK